MDMKTGGSDAVEHEDEQTKLLTRQFGTWSGQRP